MLHARFLKPRRALLALSVVAGLAASTTTASAQKVNDAAGDFLPTYTGPLNGDLDVLSSQVYYDGTKFAFTATMNGAIGTTAGGFYVWGVNRGAGTAGFGASLGLPNVLFDATVVLRPGTGVTAGGQAVNGELFYATGNTITAVIPASFLVPNGFARENFTWNLWPRATGPAGVAAISDFAPNTTNSGMTLGEIPPAVLATPEPASMVLVGAGLLGMFAAARRRRA